MMQKMLLFLTSLLIVLLGQSFIWLHMEYGDEEMWTNQVKFMDTNDPRQFNIMAAYAYPGTPTIEIAILAHRMFGISYDAAFKGALALFHAGVIASCVTICYTLRPNRLWYVATGAMLTCNRLFPFSTPPSATASLLIALLTLLTLLVYEQRNSLVTWMLTAWGITAGLSAATRADISGIIALPLFLFLVPHLRLQKSIYIVVVAACAFFIADPFMWTMPLRHIYDVVAKGLLHYEHLATTPLPTINLLLISPFGIFSILFACTFLIAHKALPKTLPHPFISMLLIITGVVSAIILNSRIQAIRYFFPLAFIWEIFLPLFILEIIEVARSSSKKIITVATVTLFVVGPLTILLLAT